MSPLLAQLLSDLPTTSVQVTLELPAVVAGEGDVFIVVKGFVVV